MTIPGHGEVSGEWDLRGREREYLGRIDLAGKSVLEIGTASGHLCFWMEKQGADVTGYDLSEEQEWDIVPYHDYDYTEHIARRKEHIRRLNNSWWYAHERFGSRARVVYGSVYEISPELGRFDVVTMGSILLHLRDPFLALQKAASVARDTMVITDLLMLSFDQAAATVLGNGRLVRFMPDAATGSPYETWWGVSPHFIAEAVQVLGFRDIHLSVHRQKHVSGEKDLYTIVARRGSAGKARYNEQAYNELILSHFHYDQYLLDRLPARRLIRHLGSRLLRRLGLARKAG
jgi:hypothetical protein